MTARRGTSLRAAAEVALVFEEPPPPARPAARPRLTVVSPTAPRRDVTPGRVAPDSHRAHGTYVKYVIERCRCELCRQANREYENARQAAIRNPDRPWLPYVPAGPARRHLRDLAAAGVGLKTVAKLTGLSTGCLSKLVYGDTGRGTPPSTRIRPDTARKILAVTVNMAAGAQKIDAAPTWRLLDDLIARGFTKTWIAHQLGQRGPGLQIRRTQVRASTARAVEALHARLRGVAAPPRNTRWGQR